MVLYVSGVERGLRTLLPGAGSTGAVVLRRVTARGGVWRRVSLTPVTPAVPRTAGSLVAPVVVVGPAPPDGRAVSVVLALEAPFASTRRVGAFR